MFVELSRSNPCEFMSKRVLTAAVTSTMIISQQVLKNAPVKPSGPGALSLGMEFSIFNFFLGGRILQRREILGGVAKRWPQKGEWPWRCRSKVVAEVISNQLFFIFMGVSNPIIVVQALNIILLGS